MSDGFGLETRSMKNALVSRLDSIDESISYLPYDYHTYWMKISYNSFGHITNVQKQNEQLRKKSVVEILDESLNMHDISSNTTYNYDGSFETTFESNIVSIAEILKNLKVAAKSPTYEEFMVDLVPKLYMNCDFEREIIDTQHIDENGNVISSGKHKPNPIDIAKKSIYRADILWNEMKKKNIVK